MRAVVYCGSMGDWPLLTDAERMEGVERLVEAGVPVIVGTGAVNTSDGGRPCRPCAKGRRAGPDGDPAGSVAGPFAQPRNARISRPFWPPRPICPP